MRPDPPGHDSGHASSSGFNWSDYLAWLVEQHGSLAAVASRLAALRGYRDDSVSIERALRRLRTRGERDGGTWGGRALAAFGLPDALNSRARWMGAYHSRFTDLPLPLCRDLLRLWDRPPVSEALSARLWLAIAHASCALRANDFATADLHLQRARASVTGAPPEARVELMLTEAFVLSRTAPAQVSRVLDDIRPLLDAPMPADDAANLRARWTDQRAYEFNHDRVGHPADFEVALALYASLPDAGAPPFARCRRANGLAFGYWRLGQRDVAAANARAGARYAGDGGHLRLRAMSLSMLGRILGADDPEGDAARDRAVAIARALDDEALRLRFEHDVRSG